MADKWPENGLGLHGTARESTTLNRRRKPNKSCIVNRQIGVGDSKNVTVFDPVLTGHVIRCMRSGRVGLRIFNGRPNQWETL